MMRWLLTNSTSTGNSTLGSKTCGRFTSEVSDALPNLMSDDSENDKLGAGSIPDHAHFYLIHHFILTCYLIGLQETVKRLSQMG